MKGRSENRLRGVRILYEDPQIFVIEKAAGVLSQALRNVDENSVEEALGDYVRKGQWKSSRRVYLVHRLDRDTSGVMVVAKTEAVQQWFREHWNEVTTKVYLARVAGALDAERGVFESYLAEDEKFFVRSVRDGHSGKFARTVWRVVEPPAGEPPSTLVEVLLKSGRKHQIRVHFAEAGHPVLGDAKYGPKPPKPPPRAKGAPEARRRRPAPPPPLCLHAWKLSFEHPATHKTLSFEAAPPRWAKQVGRAAPCQPRTGKMPVPPVQTGKRPVPQVVFKQQRPKGRNQEEKRNDKRS
jgi:tRNA pseudouridine32 synthase/23S rRNA pseudouridine746 synthase/23S rRNA pseudouridine1911/1915/1917 synthase